MYRKHEKFCNDFFFRYEHCSRNTVPNSSSDCSTKKISSLESNVRVIYPHDIRPYDCASEFVYVEHIILPENTIQGICIQYKVSPVTLRQVNQFSGSTLLLAPKRLVIPLKRSTHTGVRLQDQTTDEYKIHKILVEYPALREEEVRTYLDLNSWDLTQGIIAVEEDVNRERAKHYYEIKESKSTGTTSTSCSSLNGDFSQNERGFHHTNEKTCNASEKSHVELNMADKFKYTLFQELPKNYDISKGAENYVVEGIPLCSNTADTVKPQTRTSICQGDFYEDQSIDFGIELQDLSLKSNTRMFNAVNYSIS